MRPGDAWPRKLPGLRLKCLWRLGLLEHLGCVGCRKRSERAFLVRCVVRPHGALNCWRKTSSSSERTLGLHTTKFRKKTKGYYMRKAERAVFAFKASKKPVKWWEITFYWCCKCRGSQGWGLSCAYRWLKIRWLSEFTRNNWKYDRTKD